MRVAVIIPAHNEAAILEKNAKRVWEWGRAAFPPEADSPMAGGNFTLVISENGSTDGTAWVARCLERLLPGVIAIVSKQAGKGGAIKRGAAAVEADVYLFMDADLSTDLVSAARLVELMRTGADIAVASRRVSSAVVRRSWSRAVASMSYAELASRALRLPVRDLQCGCKAFSRRVRDELLPTVRDDGFFFDTEFLARASRAGLRIQERGVRWDEWSAPGRRSGVRIGRTFVAFLRKLAILRKELG